MRYWLAVKLCGRDEVAQQCALADLVGQSRGAALDDLARALGYHRVRTGDGRRLWVHECSPLFAPLRPGAGYRHSGRAHRAARAKVPPERRSQIASQAARARWRKRS